MSHFTFNLSDFVLTWWGLLLEAIPFVALGALLSGFLEVCVSRQTVTRLFPKHRVVGILASACVGLLFPMCECGIVPVVRRLVRKGVPVSCAITYMLASPVVNPVVIASTAVAFNRQGAWTVVGLRVGLAYLVAIAVGVLVWRVFGEDRVLLDSAGDEDHPQHGPGRRGWRVAGDLLATAASDFLQIGATLVIGAGIAALINTGFSRASMEPFAGNPFAAVTGMSIMAIALNLCSEADAFVAASFYAFPLAAKTAFLVLGPMLDVKLLMMYTTVFRPRAIVAISGATIILIWLLCVSGYVWMPALGITAG
jgi:uncharacterized protein